MENNTQSKSNPYLVPISIVLASIVLSGAWLFGGGKLQFGKTRTVVPQPAGLAESSPYDNKEIFPENGVVLPVVWGDLGWKLTSVGAIDEVKFKQLYESRGGLSEEEEKLLTGKDNGPLVITEKNASYVLNLLWALGLANKTPILEKGEMMNPRYGGAERFASTGGWTLAKGDAMEHYSKHKMFPMTDEQHALVEKVSKNIFRPCCDNGTHFPDCNHGMAMLALLELMASQGATEEQMYKVALQVNSYWFPGQYATIADYMKGKGVAWKDVSAKEMLSAAYSSSSGFRNIASGASGSKQGGGSGCGV